MLPACIAFLTASHFAEVLQVARVEFARFVHVLSKDQSPCLLAMFAALSGVATDLALFTQNHARMFNARAVTGSP
jgi:hypothetical protein